MTLVNTKYLESVMSSFFFNYHREWVIPFPGYSNLEMNRQMETMQCLIVGQRHLQPKMILSVDGRHHHLLRPKKVGVVSTNMGDNFSRVCLSVQATSFEPLKLGTSLLVHRYILTVRFEYQGHLVKVK